MTSVTSQLTGRVELNGLPMDYVAAHPPGHDGHIHITTTYPDYYPFMTYAGSEHAIVDAGREFPGVGVARPRVPSVTAGWQAVSATATATRTSERAFRRTEV